MISELAELYSSRANIKNTLFIAVSTSSFGKWYTGHTSEAVEVSKDIELLLVSNIGHH